jgi:hypothetical protein
MEQQAFLDLYRRDLIANHADHLAFHRFAPGLYTAGNLYQTVVILLYGYLL